jgi:hypothetical protein
MRWNEDQDTGYFGQNLRALTTPSTANDLINTSDGGRYSFTMWTMKINGSYDAGWGIRLTPPFVCAGAALGRSFGGRRQWHQLRLARILTEPIDAQRQDDIVILDIRTEKSFNVATGKRVGLFFDVYNLTNADAAQNINWGSGSTYQFPVTIIGPTIMRFGAKLDW